MNSATSGAFLVSYISKPYLVIIFLAFDATTEFSKAKY